MCWLTYRHKRTRRERPGLSRGEGKDALKNRPSPVKAEVTRHDDQAILAAMGQQWAGVLAAMTGCQGFAWQFQAIGITTDRSRHKRGTTMRPVSLPDLLAGVVSLGIILFLWWQ